MESNYYSKLRSSVGRKYPKGSVTNRASRSDVEVRDPSGPHKEEHLGGSIRMLSCGLGPSATDLIPDALP